MGPKQMVVMKRLSAGLRWRLGMRVAAPELEAGTDESITSFYSGRVTDCAFLDSPEHYEHPRARWILNQVSGGRLLEIGCGNGGMTRLLSAKVDHVVALDVSRPSLKAVNALGLDNVEMAEGLIENYKPASTFDWIVMSEVIEHLRKPGSAVAGCLHWLSPGGSLLITTPNGHWESDEHLHEFTLESLAAILAATAVEMVQVCYVRDAEERRRWLAARLTAAARPAALDSFNDRRETARERRRAD